MIHRHLSILRSVRITLLAGSAFLACAQPPDFGFGGRGPGGPGGPFGGPGGPGGMGQHTKLLGQFDKDGDGYLNATERKAARAFLAESPRRGRGGRGFGGFGGSAITGKPGPKVNPADVKIYANEPL